MPTLAPHLKSQKWRLSAVAVLLLGFLAIAFSAYHVLIVSPERQRVISRYDEFRAAVATGDNNLIMSFVAPKDRSWATGRVHIYEPTFVSPLNERSTVSLSFGTATICPKPGNRYLIFREGNVVEMVKHRGEWFMGRVLID